MRFLLAAITFAVLTLSAQARSGPDSIYTGVANIYVSHASRHHARHHARHRRHARRHVRHHKRHHRVARRSVHHGGIIRSRSGKTARVNPAYASRFQCIVNKLESAGYRIRFMGGYRHTKIAGTRTWSKHAIGNAIDINQTGRNRCVGGCPRMPSAARTCGLFDGSQWRHPDAGHFEVPGPNPLFTQVAGR